MNEKTIKYNLIFENTRDLYKSYMPFIKNGGFFISFVSLNISPIKINYETEFEISLKLPNEENIIDFKSPVVWLGRGGINKGIGVAIPEDINIKAKIESLIKEYVDKKEINFTF